MQPSLYLVVGLGKTGYSIARYLQRQNKPFAVFDTRKALDISLFLSEFPGVDVFLETLPETIYEHLIEMICSPGVDTETSCLQEAVSRGIPMVGDIECLARHLTVPVIAITGTNGKSTVTSLVGEMSKEAGFNVAVAGNIGIPVLDLLGSGIPYDLWVLELSSFQLELTKSLSPIAATILNITPDHLDRHHSMDAYIEAKQRIYIQAKNCVYNREDLQTFPLKQENVKTMCVSQGLSVPAAGEWGLGRIEKKLYLQRGKEILLSVEDLKLKGQHNWQNALAACALVESIGVSQAVMRRVLQRFSGLPHRCQWVRTLDGVEWINDSKGTNIGATISAIVGIGESMQGKIVLIAGGQGKGADFSALRTSMDYVRRIVLIGEDADKLETALGDLVAVTRATSLESAVLAAKSFAKPGDVVLLSPACASLDMFHDFNHRGESFSIAVEAL